MINDGIVVRLTVQGKVHVYAEDDLELYGIKQLDHCNNKMMGLMVHNMVTPIKIRKRKDGVAYLTKTIANALNELIDRADLVDGYEQEKPSDSR